MKNLLTVAAAIAVASTFTITSASAGGFNGKKRYSPAKTMSYVHSSAWHTIKIKPSGCGCDNGQPGDYTNPEAVKTTRMKMQKPGNHVHFLAKSFQTHKVWKSRYATGGSSTAGNYLNAHWKGNFNLKYKGGAYVSGGARITSGGRPPMRKPAGITR